MKKLFTLALLLAIALTIAACAGTANDDTIATPQQTIEPQDPTPEPQEPEPEPTPESEPTTEPEYPEPPSYLQESGSTFPFAFSVEDVNGNPVTEASLGEKEAFFVYFWTTWCPSCINAMPALAELAEDFGDRVGFLSLLGDFDTASDVAADIKAHYNVPFITVDSRHPDLDDVMQYLNSGFVPTSAVFDTNGNRVGDFIVGSDMDTFRATIEEALNR